MSGQGWKEVDYNEDGKEWRTPAGSLERLVLSQRQFKQISPSVVCSSVAAQLLLHDTAALYVTVASLQKRGPHCGPKTRAVI